MLTVSKRLSHPALTASYSSEFLPVEPPGQENIRLREEMRLRLLTVHGIRERNTMQVIRILHGKQDVRRILEREIPSED